jgi:hypothetical protein
MTDDTVTGRRLAVVSRWIDDHPPNRARSAEAQLWSRCAKVGEEFGEVVAAIIALTGQNPRKPADGNIGAVVDELLDVALTALAAVEHIDGNRGDSMRLLNTYITLRMKRVGLPDPVGEFAAARSS